MKNLRRYWQIIFPIIVMLIIWNFSAQNGDESDGVSLAFAAKLGLSNGVTRKIAHFLIYSILGLTLANFFRSLKPKKFPNLKALIFSLIIAVIYSSVDEYHQSLIPGRDGNPTDIIIDSLGTIAGICIFTAIICFIRQKKAEKRKFAK